VDVRHATEPANAATVNIGHIGLDWQLWVTSLVKQPASEFRRLLVCRCIWLSLSPLLALRFYMLNWRTACTNTTQNAWLDYWQKSARLTFVAWAAVLSIADTWNSLPQHVTSAPSMSVFRGRLKALLFRRSFPWLATSTAVVPAQWLSSFSDT